MAQRITASAQGVWAWILQRITAVLLAFFLGTHLFVLHYIDENLLINFAGVAARMKSVLYLFIDGGLLLVALYHALNGVRAVILDYFPGENARRSVTTVMWVLGIAFAILGLYTLTAFLK